MTIETGLTENQLQSFKAMFLSNGTRPALTQAELSIARQAEQAVLQSQDREEIMDMALCESRRLALRIGQAYRFVPMEGCKTCEEMKAEHDQAYSIDHARRIEGEGE